MGSVWQVALAVTTAVVLMVLSLALSLSHSPESKAQKVSRGIALDVPTAELEKLTGPSQSEGTKE